MLSSAQLFPNQFVFRSDSITLTQALSALSVLCLTLADPDSHPLPAHSSKVAAAAADSVSSLDSGAWLARADACFRRSSRLSSVLGGGNEGVKFSQISSEVTAAAVANFAVFLAYIRKDTGAAAEEWKRALEMEPENVEVRHLIQS